MEYQVFQKPELQSNGIFPTCGLFYGYPLPQIPRLNTPITPAENFRRFLRREQAMWVPESMADVNDYYPEIIPDLHAFEFKGGVDSFGTVWVSNLPNPAMVKPGDPVLKEMKEWRKLTMPKPDLWDWQSAADEYHKTIDKTRFSRANIVTGMFERLMSLMDYAGAAISLLIDPDEVRAFLEQTTAYNIDLIEHYKKYFNPDSVMFMDDWGHKRGPAFSHDCHRSIFLPSLKKLVKRTHELDMFFIMHSCGRADYFLPEMIEAEVDVWQPDISAVGDDLLGIIEQYGKDILFDIIWELPTNVDEEEARRRIDDFTERYLASGSAFSTLYNAMDFDGMGLRDYFYEACRKIINQPRQA